MQTVPENPAAKVVPDTASNLSKKAQVADMFNNIAGRYDFLNHFLSLGIDRGWRKKAIAEVVKIKPNTVLDVATGTGDMAIATIAAHPCKITGVDIAEQMMEIGRKKVAENNLQQAITFQLADSEQLPFPDNSFDAVMCAYGVRNFEHLDLGLTEMRRVLRPGGKVVILEFSQPTAFPVKQLYTFYCRHIMPTIGKWVSKSDRAYSYLNKSAEAFPYGRHFLEILRNCGFQDAKSRPLTFGATTIYTAIK